MDSFSLRIQIISIIISALLLLYNTCLIIKGKLRAEYAIFWILLTLILVLFSIWRNGLEFFSKLFGVYETPNLIFLVAIGSIFLYILHFSVVISKLKNSNKKLAQEIALLKEKLENIEKPENK